MSQIKKPLPQEALKLIACVTMLIDHIGAVFLPQNAALRIIGRISFPIYCFLLAEGIHHTRDPKKYGLRLLLLALLAEIPYDLLFYGGLTWAHQSVIVTFLLTFCMGMCMKQVNGIWKLAVVIPFALLGDPLHVSYGTKGVLLVAMFIIARELPCSAALRIAGLCALSWFMARMDGGLSIQIFAIAAAIPIALYSGQKVTRSKAFQWSMNLFYPVHLLVLLLFKIL